MINVKLPLQRWEVNTSGRLAAVATTREIFEQAAEEKRLDLIKEFFYDVFGMRVDVTDVVVGRIAAQYAVDEVSQTHYEFGNAPMVIERAFEKAVKFHTDPNNAWMFATDASQSSFKTENDVVKAPKKNKGTAALELYNQHVNNAEKPLTNGEFVDLLVKELQMTKSGARTYAYNCFKQGKQA